MAAIVRAVGRLAVVCFVLSGIDCAQGDVNSRSQRHAALTLLTDDVLRLVFLPCCGLTRQQPYTSRASNQQPAANSNSNSQ
eukprot:m.140768 g.140768  ORF g.140768 m.140768 type:complete len:81 (-) comp17093_c0_seq5:114-356(-)